MRFEIFNDLKFIGYNYVYRNDEEVFDYRYIKRGLIALGLSLIGGFTIDYIYGPIIVYLILIILNVINGFKPWYYTFEFRKDSSVEVNFIRYKLFYSHKMSLQYLLIWDIGGVIIGGLWVWVIKLIQGYYGE